MSVEAGQPAPDFEAALDDGTRFRLSDRRGKNVVLYFYPADNTPVCTAQACLYRDNYDQIRAFNAEIVGVSSNDEESHGKFKKKHGLPFPLIADPSGAVRDLYGARSFFGLRPSRITFVIDAQGIVRSVFKHEFSANSHLADTLAALKALSQ